ncbi:MAG: hypothetical protein M1814_004122 [Vezdaea aestivalis]|nr:MAG: hypothetical protein M1814_004122 [Vezdaea aestivalis]
MARRIVQQPGNAERTAIAPETSSPDTLKDPLSSQISSHLAPNGLLAATAPNGRIPGRPGHTDLPSATASNSAGSMEIPRDSHDLSYNQRDGGSSSLVDSMLMSLDRFSGPPAHGPSMPPQMTEDERQLYGCFQDEQPQPLASSSRFSLFKNSRRRGHTQSSSQSDVPARFSMQSSRERRHNSTSTRESSLGKIGDINGKGRIESQRAAPPSGRPRRNTHGSKGSGYSSLDLGSSKTRENKPWLLDQRPTGIDRATGERISHSSPSYGAPRPPQLDIQQTTFPYDHYDAAPTPTVRVGPSRPQSPSFTSFPPHPQHSPPQIPPLERKRSTRSSKSHHTKKGRFIRIGSTRAQGDQPHQLPGIPTRGLLMTHADPAAPSPSIPFEKPSPYVPSEPAVALKEKPGFFRRMFSSNRTVSNDSRAGSLAPEEPESWLQQARDREISRTDPSQLPQSMPGSPRRDSKQPSTMPLNKKSSSFFRRRRKSIHDLFETPIVPAVPSKPGPPQTPKEAPEQEQQSPVSSLRRVMNPYLENPDASTEAFFDTREHFQTPDGSEAGQTRKNSASYFSEVGQTTVRMVSGESSASAGQQPMQPKKESLRRTPTSPKVLTTTSPHTTPRIGATPRSPALSDRTASPGLKDRMPTRPPPPEPKISSSSLTSHTPKSNLSISIAKAGRTPDSGALSVSPRSGTFTSSPRSPRIFLDASSSPIQSNSGEEHGLVTCAKASKDSVVGSQSEISDYKSVSSVPVVHMNDEPVVDLSKAQSADASENPVADESVVMAVIDTAAPTGDDRRKAKSIFDGQEDIVPKSKAAAWMGEASPASSRIRQAYMDLFDFSNFNVLASMRILCESLILKGETQQVDRILDSFTDRWCNCNPNHGFKSRDIIHTVCYSILLLNTDLHLADIEQKMTKSQFVKNAMPTIRDIAAQVSKDIDFDARDSSKMLNLPPRSSTLVSEPPSPMAPPQQHSSTFPRETKDNRLSIDDGRPSFRLSARPSILASFDDTQPSTPLDFDTSADDCGPLVKTPFNGSMRTWEVQVEIVLKSFFTSIRHKRLPLHGAPVSGSTDDVSQNNHNLLGATNSSFRRTPSVLSKTPSEAASFRGRPESSRLTTGRWSSKTRSRPRIAPISNAFASSRTSLDEQSTIWSPSASSIWSRNSFGRTQTSMSIDSYGSAKHTEFHQSIGFANALSQAIIREEASNSDAQDRNGNANLTAVPLLEDDTLGLAGAPWAKEGILKHKHYLETVEKKAKDRNWNEAFAVIEKGWLRLFSFTGKNSIRGARKKAGTGAAGPLGGGSGAGSVVGGGNWAENAEAIGSFLLRQTIASALPPPGYSKSRPHVWALSFPTGAVHLFSVGTPDIVKEFVSTANYWSARLSKEPLVGGISNIEYGWSDAVLNPALLPARSSSATPTPEPHAHPPSRSASSARVSIQSSIRSSLDHQTASRTRLFGDRLTLSDWQPPQQSMMASALLEVDQHKALTSYVGSIETELAHHNERRAAMQLAYSPRSANSARAMANWERKSSYLVVEVIKFKTYVDCLKAAMEQRERVLEEREKERKRKSGELEEQSSHQVDLGETALPGLVAPVAVS